MIAANAPTNLRKAALGNYTDILSNAKNYPLSQRHKQANFKRAILYHAQHAIRKYDVMNRTGNYYHRIAYCQNLKTYNADNIEVNIATMPDGSMATLGNVISCGSHSCPHCAPRVALKNVRKADCIITGLKRLNLMPIFITFNAQHSRHDELSDFKERFNNARNYMTGGRWWRDLLHERGLAYRQWRKSRRVRAHRGYSIMRPLMHTVERSRIKASRKRQAKRENTPVAPLAMTLKQLYRARGIECPFTSLLRINAQEVTRARYWLREDNGWHYHRHELWFVPVSSLRRVLTENPDNTLAAVMRAKWIQCLERYGLSGVADIALDVRVGGDVPARYLAKIGAEAQGATHLDLEIASAGTTTNSDGDNNAYRGASIFDILHRAANGDMKATELYSDYVEAMDSVHMFEVSKGIYRLIDLDALMAELYPVGEENDAHELLTTMTENDLIIVNKLYAAPMLRDVAAITRDSSAVQSYLASLRQVHHKREEKIASHKNDTDYNLASLNNKTTAQIIGLIRYWRLGEHDARVKRNAPKRNELKRLLAYAYDLLAMRESPLFAYDDTE